MGNQWRPVSLHEPHDRQTDELNQESPCPHHRLGRDRGAVDAEVGVAPGDEGPVLIDGDDPMGHVVAGVRRVLERDDVAGDRRRVVAGRHDHDIAGTDGRLHGPGCHDEGAPTEQVWDQGESEGSRQEPQPRSAQEPRCQSHPGVGGAGADLFSDRLSDRCHLPSLSSSPCPGPGGGGCRGQDSWGSGGAWLVDLPDEVGDCR